METDLQNLPQLLVQHFDEARGIANKRIGEIGLSIISELFKTEGASSGSSWEDIKEAYRLSKIRHGYSEKILHRGNKAESLRQSMGFESNNEKVIIGTKVFYAPYHEKGTSKMPARKFLEPTEYQILFYGIPGQELISAWEAINS